VKRMPVVKIGPKHQVTIPKEIFDELYLQPGDFLEAVAQDGKIIMTPKQLTDKAPAPPLTKKEQQALPRVKEKIGRIQTDMVNSQGLDDDEVKLAAKVGLIDPEQAWWWREEWQKGEREAEKDIAQNETSGPFRSVHGLIEHLSKG
jgi:AbrB family looped-hinge helix DNA binding protein